MCVRGRIRVLCVRVGYFLHSMKMRGCVYGPLNEALIAVIMCVIKPSALLAIRITLDHVDGIGSYSYCVRMCARARSGLFTDTLWFFIHPKAYFPIYYAHSHIDILFFSKYFGIWLKRVQTYLYFHSNLTFQFRRIGGIFISYIVCASFFCASHCSRTLALSLVMLFFVFDFRWLVP